MNTEQLLESLKKIVKDNYSSEELDDYSRGRKDTYLYVISIMKQFLNEEIRESGETQCKHEFVTKEYTSQPYGTCLSCGQTIFGLH
jgi:RNA polymerase-binding transcription factor DksA